jgi:radical SAM superfamily enzyme YgiQ (UPF0313 family)
MVTKTDYKVGLFSMPAYQPVYMHPALAYIAGYLKKNVEGVSVYQRDLNTWSLEHYLGKEITESMRDINTYRDFESFRKIKRDTSEKIREITGGKLRVERNTITYDCGEDYKSREGLLNAVKNKEEDPYYDFFKNEVLPQIKNLDLIGLSVSDQKQIIPTIILSSMIKEKYGDAVKVAIGGNIITRDYDVLSEDDDLNRELFQHFDYLVHHEGEVTFYKLVKRLKESQDVEKVPKLIYKQDGRIKENLEFVIENVNNIPSPDYDGFIQQGNHWTPKPVIPYLVGRGCDWGGCSFCDIPAGYDMSRARMEKATGRKFEIENRGNGKRRDQDLDKVVNELKELSEKYDTKYFSFSDEELAGELLEDFVDKIIDSNLDIEWEMYGRIEDLYLDKSFCEKLRKAGCRFIQFGVESASQKVLNTNRKGYNFGIAEDVLKNTYDAGIMNHVFLLVGIPGDDLLEASKLIPFLEKNGRYLTTIKPISYKVSKWSPISLRPEIFGVKLDKKNTPDLEQRINVAKNTGLMSRHKAMDFVKLLELWVAKNHKINPATSEYMYVQRLFLSRGELEEFGKSVDYKVELREGDLRAIKSIFNGLREEVKFAAYQDKSIDANRRKQFEILYKKLKEKKSPTELDKIMELIVNVSRI